MTILPHFLHFVISYCKSSLNVGKTYWKFTKSSLSYVKKSGKSNGKSYNGRTKRFDGNFTPIPSFCGIFFEIGPKSKSNLVESTSKQAYLMKKSLENRIEEITLAERNVLMAILPQFLHSVISYCKSSLNFSKT